MGYKLILLGSTIPQYVCVQIELISNYVLMGCSARPGQGAMGDAVIIALQHKIFSQKIHRSRIELVKYLYVYPCKVERPVLEIKQTDSWLQQRYM